MQDKVREFMVKHDQGVGMSHVDHRLLTLRSHLINEELGELMGALFHEDWENVFDSYGDLLYVVLGIGAMFDLPVDEIFRRVHVSNMTKQVKDERVKCKGEDYEPPIWGDIVRRWKSGGFTLGRDEALMHLINHDVELAKQVLKGKCWREALLALDDGR